MIIDTEVLKKEFTDILLATKRNGIEDVIAELDDMGFFIAPASAGHHLNVPGGLVQHSLNTYKAALKIYEGMKALDPSLSETVQYDSIAIAALLHDVCKSDIYKPTTKKKKNSFGVWEEVPGYDVSYKGFPMGHGEKSVILLLCSGLELSDDEMLAIRWHMGAWGLNMNSFEDERNYDTAKQLYPLVSIIHAADFLAASILENEEE